MLILSIMILTLIRGFVVLDLIFKRYLLRFIILCLQIKSYQNINNKPFQQLQQNKKSEHTQTNNTKKFSLFHFQTQFSVKYSLFSSHNSLENQATVKQLNSINILQQMIGSQPNQSSLYHVFNIYSKLIQISEQQPQQKLNPLVNSKQQIIKQLEQDFSRSVTRSQYIKYQTSLFNYLKSLANNCFSFKQKNQNSNQNEILLAFKAFLQSFSQTKFRILNQENVIDNMDQVKLYICDKKKMYSLQDQIIKKIRTSTIKNNQNNKNNKNANQQQLNNYRAYVIYGKAINVQKKKKVNPTSIGDNPSGNTDDLQQKQKIITQVQYYMTRMYEEQKLPYLKNQPHELEDLIISHPLDDNTILPIIVTNQVYRNFVPLDFAILLLIPEHIMNQNSKIEVLPILKDTLLHVHLQNHKSVSRIISRESYFKNSTFKGIYFVDEGEVQTKSGRIVARGWIINGKCKSTTQVWRFTKILTFFKFILQNQNIWKQFVNDLKLNGQWPIKVSDLLNIDQKQFEIIMGEQAAIGVLSGKGHKNNKRLRFPPISGRLNKSFDINKLSQIQKVKHFNQKINHLSDFKQQILKRKLQNISRKKSLYSQNQSNSQASQKQQRQMNKKIQYLSQKYSLSQKGLKTDNSRSVILRPGQSSANILITGIVKKLKSMHQPQHQSQVNSSRQSSIKRMNQLNKSRGKILGLQRYQQILKTQKNHLFKGKNVYH